MANVFTLADAVRTSAAREVYGKKLVDLGKKYDNIVVMTADLMRSDKIEEFKEAYPDRAFSVGIAEQNMVSIAAGLALTGKIVFCSTMAPFMTMRACEQVRTDVDYGNLKVRLIGSHSGLSSGSGPTHAGQEDIAIMRALPNMTVVAPGDPGQTAKVIEASIDWDGPVYIRIGRGGEPLVYKEDEPYDYQIGKSITVRDGKQATIFACGPMLYHANKAATLLADEGYDIRVVDMHTIKPIDKEAIARAAEETGNILVAEDHNVTGGLASAVADVIADLGLRVRFRRVGIPDVYCCIGTAEDMYAKYGMDFEGIRSVMRDFLK
jgi:transketolase